MTKSAQQALKILIQNIKTPTRFCLITNYISRVDTSLRNYCVSMRFNQLPPKKIFETLYKININEKIGFSKLQTRSIQTKYNSDMRSMINYMQTVQTNMKNILTNDTWKKLLGLFCKDTSTKRILCYIENTVRKYNINIIELLKEFFNYIIRNHIEYITSKFLKMVADILHNGSPKRLYILNYFIIHMRDVQKGVVHIDNNDILCL